MASTYSTNLRLELIGTGEQQGTWGSTTNKNLGTLLEQAICGYESVTVSNSTDTILTATDGTLDQSRNMVLNLIGTITASRNVICPAIEKVYVVKNATTGGFPVTFKVSGQTGVSIPNGATLFLYVDNTDVRQITGSIASQTASNVAITGGTITGITDLAIADGGTGASDAATARTNLGLAIGTNVQAYDATLQSLSALGTAADRYAYTTGVDTWTQGTITAAGRAILDDADAAAQRTTLGLGTSATLNVGTAANNVVQLDGTAKLPAVDGSQLTNLPIPAATGRLLRAPQILTSGTSYTTPADCTSIYVELVGGGGGGGGGNIAASGGGGGGAYAAKYFTVTASTAYTYAIGAGATANSGSGGNTTFTVGATTVTAGGGGGGGTSGSTPPTSAAGGGGGTATNGDINVSGGSGNRGFTDTSYATVFTGSGGVSGLGFGAGGQSSHASSNATLNGSNASGYGGGGGGGQGTGTGGDGTSGVIRVWEYA